MHRANDAAIEGEWTVASKKHACKVCGGNDRCRSGFDGQFACCVRVPSQWPLTVGGWVHRIEVVEPKRRGAPHGGLGDLLGESAVS